MTGGGANGKTTSIEAVCFALGDYAMTAEPTLLMGKRGDAHPTGVADLLGQALRQHRPKPSRIGRFDIALLKRLTGGDTIKARFMRQDFFSFTPSHLLMMATNHLPEIDDDTEAVWRRIRVIPFTVEIPDSRARRAPQGQAASRGRRGARAGSSTAGPTTGSAAGWTSPTPCWSPPRLPGRLRRGGPVHRR